MDELVNRLVARTGISRMIAEQSTGVIHSLPPLVRELGGATHGAAREPGQFT
ncbi:MAG TPA: hypothetical protein VEK73_12110 [Xanthobacteraceae bacterium]|nr:hypothetical protein [Xanthobacteraceae bacterium]